MGKWEVGRLGGGGKWEVGEGGQELHSVYRSRGRRVEGGLLLLLSLLFAGHLPFLRALVPDAQRARSAFLDGRTAKDNSRGIAEV